MGIQNEMGSRRMGDVTRQGAHLMPGEGIQVFTALCLQLLTGLKLTLEIDLSTNN